MRKSEQRAAGPPSKPEDYYRVNTFFTSLDKVLAETENQFLGYDQDVLCTLSDVTLSDSPASDSFGLVAGHYNFDKELIQGYQCLFNPFKKTHVKISIKGAAEVIDMLHENSLYEITPKFLKVVTMHFGRHSHNIMLSRMFVQQTPAVEDLPS